MNELLAHLIHLFAEHHGSADPDRPTVITASTEDPENNVIITWRERAYLVQVEPL